MTKYQEAEDRQHEMFTQIQTKLYKTTEALNGVQVQALAIWGKAIEQGASDNLTSLRRSKDVKKETDLGIKSLETKERLKAADEYLVRLRHKLNMQQEKEHGAQVRRNINLRHNMDNFNDALNNVKKAITGGAGFQSAIGTTVSKMARMTRSYQELELANKKRTDTAEQLQLKTDTVNNLQGSDDKEAKKNADDALKIAQSAHQSAEEGVLAATKPAQGTQGMFKPMFEKLSKLGDFLGKKAVPIGIGIGVAGIFMSIIVKALSASPLFASMMKMMKFMVTLILMPIGTFFGALLRPILIMLLRKFIVPMFSKWMPKMLLLGTALGKWITELTPAKIAEALKDFITGKTPGGLGDKDGDGILDGDDDDNAPNPYNFLTENDKWWEEEKRRKEADYKAGNVGLFDAAGETPESDIDNPDETSTNGTSVEWDMSGENPMFNGKTPPLPEEPDWEAIEKESGMYPVDQEKKDRKEAADALAKEERERAQNEQNQIMKDSVTTGGIITEALEPIAQYVENPRFIGTAMEGKLSSITNAGISEGAYEAANAPKGHVSSSNYSQATKDLLARAGGVAAANGFDGMVNSPTLFLAGESGSEHVRVTPNGSGGGSGGITVNIGTMNGSDNDLRKLKKTILEVIQESSANRGRL